VLLSITSSGAGDIKTVFNRVSVSWYIYCACFVICVLCMCE